MSLWLGFVPLCENSLVCAIGTLRLHDLVVDAEQHHRRYPITYKQTRVLLAEQSKQC